MSFVRALMISYLSGFISTYILIRHFRNFLLDRGIYGIDIHKPNKPKVAEMGGIFILIGSIISSLSFLMFVPLFNLEIMSFILVLIIAGFIGFIDDLKPLNPHHKPIFLLLSGLPIILFSTYNPVVKLPFIPPFRIPIILLLLTPIALSVTSNASNMFDVVNGAMSGSSIIILLSFIASSYFLQTSSLFYTQLLLVLSVILLAPLSAFYLFNKYPASIFPGDVGTLMVGAGIGAITIMCGIEFIGIVALIPQISNAFASLSSIGGLFERREVIRPVKVENGLLYATRSKHAPITLTRFICLSAPKREIDVAKILLGYSLLCAFCALLSSIFLVWEVV
ncbi:hypothetical protein B6U74_04160 [Candidatus Bathyarchaeota archaeon ex4484_205]|nr:MAG: hypothetical protein B6U74_04160 [Candidatus Bathyarchaeota archaeon ex4484_205]RLG69209.1 MAG: hypothetical protein DRN93_00710 [archaeon]